VMNATTISSSDLSGLAADLLAARVRVAGPARASDGTVEYRHAGAPAELVLDSGVPRRSLKEFFLPPTEPLFAWRTGAGGRVELLEAPLPADPAVVIGARPCDAAGIEALDKVMGWDYRDEPWFARREATTIVSLACAGFDRSCMCTSVGLAPDTTKGSDLLLVPIGGGAFRAEVVTAKGARLVAAYPARFRPASGEAEAEAFRKAAREKVAASAPPAADPLRPWLDAHFDHPLWREASLRCHGCGACAAVCPTCHCFDIVDEPETVGTGVRRRNWDTCQTPRFTIHASGHNPKNDQPARIRQRVLHKIVIYPKKFGEMLCTGCGRCSRACPGGMDLPEVLARIAALAGGAQ